MGGIVSGIGSAVGGIIGGIGASKGAKEQARSNDRAMDNQMAMYEKQLELLEPFRKAGVSGLEGLQGMAGKPIDRNALTAEYLKSPEYQMMADQARYQQLASAEATGGLGSSSNGNALAAITPQLVQQYLGNMQGQQQDMYNQLMGLTNVGLSGAGAQSAASAGNANAMGALYGQQGAINAGRKALPWQIAAGANNSINNGASQDINQFGGMVGKMFGGMMGGAF
ncbi:DNA transfer protein [Xenorhabdus sp. XENO-7]|uniref:DNA transfer protein n=1 Tax=Xenorhabdus aichiensis TaxID=3025874 RepID=A0ABT5M0T2_9GAMM|nr:DNA transfer protein [Xenorhabdus aichiensis]MDC9621066.1 DNA transfer protein [Xenorhabdus aichiensis]